MTLSMEDEVRITATNEDLKTRLREHLTELTTLRASLTKAFEETADNAKAWELNENVVLVNESIRDLHELIKEFPYVEYEDTES